VIISKTRKLVVTGITFLAFALSALGGATASGAAPLNTGVGADSSPSAPPLTSTPKLPRCYPPECYYA
jgi:hypothetical protein